MAEFWNDRFIAKPVNCKMKITAVDHTDILCKARKTLKECAQYFSKKSAIHKENAILKQLIYRKNGQLRREKSFQGLKQIESAVRRLRDLDLQEIASDMHEDFKHAELETAILSYLPSRQMWEHMLTRILGVAALASSIISRCLTVFVHVKRHLSTGNLIALNLTFLVVLSKIWVHCQSLSKACQKWYHDLHPLLSILAPTNVRWLPEDQELPCDLKAWLKSHAFSPALQETVLEETSDELSLLLEKYHQVQTDDVEEKKQSNICDKEVVVPYLDFAYTEDLGEPVSLNEADVAGNKRSVEEADQKATVGKKKSNQIEPMSLNEADVAGDKGSVEEAEQKATVRKKKSNQIDLTRQIQEASSFLQLRRIMKNHTCSTSSRVNTRYEKCMSVVTALSRKAGTAIRRTNVTKFNVYLQRAKTKLQKFCQWAQEESIRTRQAQVKNGQKSKTKKQNSKHVNTKSGGRLSKSKTSTLVTENQLKWVVKTLRTNQSITLKGQVCKLSKEEASLVKSEIKVFTNKMSMGRLKKSDLKKAARILKMTRKKQRLENKGLNHVHYM